MSDQQKDELTDYDRKLANDERRRFRMLAEEEQKLADEQEQKAKWAGVSRMSNAEFENFKRFEIKKAEAAKAAKEKKSA